MIRPAATFNCRSDLASSSTGTITGGSLMMRSSPSTDWVSLSNARRLFFRSALATALSYS